MDGSDLLRLGMKPGKELGQTLNRLLEIVLENPSFNEKECLLEILQKDGLPEAPQSKDRSAEQRETGAVKCRTGGL